MKLPALLSLTLLGIVSNALAQTPDASAPAFPNPTPIPAPDAGLVATDPSYRLAIGDHVAIMVHGEGDMSASQRIDFQGRVRLPMVDEVPLANLSVREAEQALERLYRDRQLLKRPLVNINVVAFALREVAVLGAVRSPGNFTFPREVTSLDIVDLITRVGGFLPTGKSDSVTVTRRMPDGRESTFNLDVERMISGRRAGGANRRDFAVLPGDRIWVPERLF